MCVFVNRRRCRQKEQNAFAMNKNHQKRISIGTVFSHQMTDNTQTVKRFYQYAVFMHFIYLYLLPEDGLCLSTKTLLLPIVTSSSLSTFALLGLFILRYLVQFMNFAFFAKGSSLLGNVNLKL